MTASVNLSPATTYHYRVKSENAKGTSFGGDRTFTTLGKVPDRLTKDATNVKPTEATLNGTINPNLLPTTVTFEYGLTTSYGSSVTFGPISGDVSTVVSTTIIGLTTGQLYHFRIKAENQLGSLVGDDKTFIPFHPIGSSFQGGVLGYVFQPEDPGYEAGVPHGLIVAPAEYTTPLRWAGQPKVSASVHGLLPFAIGYGKINTGKIVAAYPNSPVPFAALACQDLVLNGYDDWFLPSVDEYKAIDNREANVALGLSGRRYYTSCDPEGYDNFYLWRYDYNTNPEFKGKAVSANSAFHGFRAMRYF